MANVVIFDPNSNPKKVLRYIASVNTPDYSSRTDTVVNPDVSALIAQPIRYWKVVAGVVQLMTTAEQNAVDAAIAAALLSSQRQDATNVLSDISGTGKLERALIIALVQQFNALRGWDVSFQAAVAASTSLANLQTRVAALPSLGDITKQNVIDTLTLILAAGTADA